MASASSPTPGHATPSLWQQNRELPVYDDPVPDDLETEVCIVGAGISGLSVAYALARDGARVTVVDDGPVGGGETGRTSAHLSCALDDRYVHLESLFGEAGARLAAQSHRAAIESIASTVAQLEIACEFRRVDGYLFAGGTPRRDDSLAPELARELAAATRAGLDVSEVAQAPLPFATGRCLRFANQAEIDPLAYLRGVAAAIITEGGRIHTGVHVHAIEGGDAPHVQLADGRIIRASSIVDASNASITSRYDLPLRQAAYRSYVLGVEVAPGEIPHALYWDTEDPYHYLRMVRGEGGREILIVGGADHRTGHGDPTTAWDALEAWTRERVPSAGAVVSRWSGQIMEPADALGYVGAARGLPNVFVVSGDSGNGLTNGAIAGLLLPALIRGESHLWTKLYAPTRSRHHGLGTLLRESTSSTVRYADWLGRSDVSSLAEIAPGHGAVLRHGAHRIAAYRDPSGGCHLRSAACPHLHAVVRWNPVERSWDCPAHGSRFAPCGGVINAPSAYDLPELDADVEAAVRAGESAALQPQLTRTTRVVQGAYYVATGLWPVLHLRSFEAVTGRKKHGWFIRALGGAIAAVGVALLTNELAARRRAPRLGLGAAVALGVAGLFVTATRRGSRAYVADAVVEAGFAAAWLAVERRRPHAAL
ncbi:MAG TPA: FAD-dependent oxidoreductase [Kofleriaceae bacterium]|nr:FAD-dependent oxidoreductase [Kofleriaceae bacterium]